MLTPKWLSGCADSLVTLYAEAERSILDDMARRISTYDFYIPAAQYQEEKLAMMGMTRKEIVQALSARTGKCTAEIERIMEEGVSASPEWRCCGLPRGGEGTLRYHELGDEENSPRRAEADQRTVSEPDADHGSRRIETV